MASGVDSVDFVTLRRISRGFCGPIRRAASSVAFVTSGMVSAVCGVTSVASGVASVAFCVFSVTYVSYVALMWPL